MLVMTTMPLLLRGSGLFPTALVPVALRKSRIEAALGAATASPARSESPAYWVCLALLLALVALAARIASIW
jgi:hypothetical protein